MHYYYHMHYVLLDIKKKPRLINYGFPKFNNLRIRTKIANADMDNTKIHSVVYIVQYIKAQVCVVYNCLEITMKFSEQIHIYYKMNTTH